MKKIEITTAMLAMIAMACHDGSYEAQAADETSSESGYGSNQPSPLKRVYFGEARLHTGNSFDGFTIGVRVIWVIPLMLKMPPGPIPSVLLNLMTVWKDPDFDSKQRAFYYARVIEIPTPHWTTYDAKRFNEKIDKTVSTINQECA